MLVVAVEPVRHLGDDRRAIAAQPRAAATPPRSNNGCRGKRRCRAARAARPPGSARDHAEIRSVDARSARPRRESRRHAVRRADPSTSVTRCPAVDPAAHQPQHRAFDPAAVQRLGEGQDSYGSVRTEHAAPLNVDLCQKFRKRADKADINRAERRDLPLLRCNILLPNRVLDPQMRARDRTGSLIIAGRNLAVKRPLFPGIPAQIGNCPRGHDRILERR